jgi:hypothetical protein
MQDNCKVAATEQAWYRPMGLVDGTALPGSDCRNRPRLVHPVPLEDQVDENCQ